MDIDSFKKMTKVIFFFISVLSKLISQTIYLKSMRMVIKKNGDKFNSSKIFFTFQLKGRRDLRTIMDRNGKIKPAKKHNIMCNRKYVRTTC